MIRGLKCKRDQFRNYGSRQSLRLLRNLDRADTVRARQLLGIADLGSNNNGRSTTPASQRQKTVLAFLKTLAMSEGFLCESQLN
jgi:hypothetical protein